MYRVPLWVGCFSGVGQVPDTGAQQSGSSHSALRGILSFPIGKYYILRYFRCMHSVRWRGMEGHCSINIIAAIAKESHSRNCAVTPSHYRTGIQSPPRGLPSHPSVNSSGNQKTALPDPAGANRLRTRVGAPFVGGLVISVCLT